MGLDTKALSCLFTPMNSHVFLLIASIVGVAFDLYLKRIRHVLEIDMHSWEY